MTVAEIPASQLTLFLTGLEHATEWPGAFARILARADRSGPPRATSLLNLFGIDLPAGQDVPVAAICRVADMGVIDNDWWIHADPVYLQPQRDGLFMRHALGLAPAESERLVAELNEALAPEGWLLKAPHPERWYLKPAREPHLTTTPLAEASGHNVHPLLPQGKDCQLWHTRLNELQILLHTSPVNAGREARGLLPANSVWFWGGGRLPRLGKTEWTLLWTDDALANGLARLSGTPARALSEFPGNQSPTERELLVLDLAHSTAETLHAVVAALHTGRYRSLTVLTDHGPVYRYLSWHRWRFWRRATQQAAA